MLPRPVPVFSLVRLLLVPLVLLGAAAGPAVSGLRAAPANPPSPAAAVVSLPAAPDDPVLWPEPQRAFFQDGPQLLLSEAQRGALARLDAGARQRWIDSFLGRGPGGGAAAATPGLAEGIARRQALVAREFVSPADVRAQLLFLNGAPAARTILECGSTFKPIEVWSYRGGSAAEAGEAGSIVVFQPAEDEPWRAWSPGESKRELYARDMEYAMEQWEEEHRVLAGGRFDLRMCKDARLIDRVTGIEGLGSQRGKHGQAAGQQEYALRPGGQPGETLLDPPGDLAAWARQAAATPLPPGPAPLVVRGIDLQFPTRAGQRMVTRAAVTVEANGRIAVAAPAAEAPAGAAAQQVGLTVEGAVEEAGKVFDAFHLRYRMPAPAAGQPVTIAVDRELRPHRAFVLRLRVIDDGNGAQAAVARGFVVPVEPGQAPSAAAGTAAGPAVALAAGQPAHPARQLPGPVPQDTVTLTPPDQDVIFGLWRTEATVTGSRIDRVAFSVDGKTQLSRRTAPYTVELRLNRTPIEQVVRADGYDAQGRLVASDQLLVNQPRGGLAVAIQEPARGERVSGTVKAVAQVTVPPERRVEAVEFRLNGALAATVTQPPWAAEIDVPANADTVYLTVSAQLDDGNRAEEVRFLRSPNPVDELAVNLVELYTAVVDGAGQPVRGLTADDFQVLENGQPQTVAKFQLVDNLPLTLGILIDTSGSMTSSLGEAVRAAGAFLQHAMRPGDRCFTLTFSDRPVLRMPLTDDPRAAAESIDRLQAEGATSIHDALVHSLYYFRGTRGQRAIVLLSDGDDTSSQLTFDEALEYAKRSGVAIYTIGLNIPKHSLGIRGKLNRLAEATGGRVFYVGKASELAGAYGEIESELRSRYLLAFQSGQQAAAGGYRQVEVKMRKGDLKARTIRGYYP